MARPREFDIDEVLQAAMDAFWRHGYEGTSMADLMEAMRLQKGSIYKAFGDKHTLFMQALGRYLDDGFQALSARFAAAESPRIGIQCWLQQMVVPGCCDKQNRGCFAVNALVELDPHDGEAAARLKKHFHRLERLLAETIARGQQCGELRTDKPASELAEFVMTIVAGLLAGAKRPHAKARDRRLADFTLEVLSA